jgi:hypothetical protein
MHAHGFHEDSFARAVPTLCEPPTADGRPPTADRIDRMASAEITAGTAAA